MLLDVCQALYDLKFASHLKGTISRDEFGFWGLYSLIQHQPLLVQYKHQANPLLSMNSYSPLVYRRNDKNEQLILLSQRKLAFTQ